MTPQEQNTRNAVLEMLKEARKAEWTCTCCGAVMSNGFDPRWRCAGSWWEHCHPEAQCHFEALPKLEYEQFLKEKAHDSESIRLAGTMVEGS